jgi:DNA invertase Pin-like site-specific DNA recombinase
MILGYARVSTDDQVGGTSLTDQENKVRGFAQMQGAGKYDFSVYVDEGVSGSVPLIERPRGREMLTAAGKGDIIVAAKLDRLFRSCKDALNAIDDLRDRGIKVVLLDISHEPVTDNGVGSLVFKVLAAIAEFERERIAERAISGQRCKRERGGHLGGDAPYGFRVVGKERDSRLIVEPKEQKLLEAVREISQAETSPTRIKRELEARGFRTRNGREFQLIQVQRLVRRAERDNPAQ